MPSGIKCSNCKAMIPANCTKCEYCDVEISIIDSGNNISVSNLAQTAKVKGSAIKEKAVVVQQKILKIVRNVSFSFLAMIACFGIVDIAGSTGDDFTDGIFGMIFLIILALALHVIFKKYIKD